MEAVAEGEPVELGQQLHREPGAGQPNEGQEQSQVAAPIEQVGCGQVRCVKAKRANSAYFSLALLVEATCARLPVAGVTS